MHSFAFGVHRVDIDINGYQQPHAESNTLHRIVSWFTGIYIAIGRTSCPGKYSGALPPAETTLPWGRGPRTCVRIGVHALSFQFSGIDA